jgi:hypothetical protein
MKSKLFSLVFVLMALNVFSQNSISENSNQKPWLDELITKGKIGKNPINDIKSYFYKDALVYLVNFEAECCDNFSAVLMDENGKTICHPFGGFSGRGDMKCTDFLKEKTEEKVIWVNENPVKESEKKERSFKMEKSGN